MPPLVDERVAGCDAPRRVVGEEGFEELEPEVGVHATGDAGRVPVPERVGYPVRESGCVRKSERGGREEETFWTHLAKRASWAYSGSWVTVGHSVSAEVRYG